MQFCSTTLVPSFGTILLDSLKNRENAYYGCATGGGGKEGEDTRNAGTIPHLNLEVDGKGAVDNQAQRGIRIPCYGRRIAPISVLAFLFHILHPSVFFVPTKQREEIIRNGAHPSQCRVRFRP